jgi:HK97 family phage major capsid protein
MTPINNELRAKTSAAYRHFLRHGVAPSAETRDLISSTTTGASLVPQGYDEVWTDALSTVSPIVSLVHSKLSPDGRPWKQVIVDPTAQYLTLVGESNSTTSISQTPSLSSNITNQDSLVGRVNVSWQELDDSFNLESWLRSTASVVVGKSLERAILRSQDGAGTTLPNSPTGGLLAAAPTGFTQSHLADGIPYATVRSLISSLEHVYMRGLNSGLLGSQSVHDYFAAQVDSTGRELYHRDPNTGNLLLNGYQLYVANNTAAPAYNAASSNVLLAGDFSRAWGIAYTDVRFRVVDINPQTLTSTVLFYVRMGGTALLPSAVKALTTAAS